MFRKWALVIGAALVAIPIAAKADTININYYTISNSYPDANELQGGVFNNEVQNSLGSIAGMPVLNLTRYGCVSNCYTQPGAPGFPLNGTGPNANVLSAGEITYWDPAANPYVTECSLHHAGCFLRRRPFA